MTKKNNTPKRRGGLGRGMDALFSNYEELPAEHERVEEISLDDIRPNPYQPRKVFDEDALNELAESIKQNGVFQPVILRRSVIKGYELIAGERRYRASRLAGNTTIPAIVRQLNDEQMIEIAVVENLQREDLSPLEEAEAYQTLMDKLSLTQAEVADRIGKSRPYIANYLRLLSLPQDVKNLLNQGDLSMGQARTLLAVRDRDQLSTLAKKVVEEGITVRQLEELVQAMNGEQEPNDKPLKRTRSITKPAHIRAVEQELQARFQTEVTLNQRGNRGKIEIEYLSNEDLQRILDLLQIQL